MEDGHPQYHVDVLLPLERRSGFRRRRLLGGVGISRGEQLLRQVAAISDDAHGGRAGPLRGADRRPWAREVARRQTILCTYDAHETGVVEDNVDGGVMVAGQWFNSRPPLAPADGDGDARLAAGVVRPGPREPHHADPLPWSATFATARAGWPTGLSMPRRLVRTCCGWPLRRRPSRPTASRCNSGRTRRKTATRSSHFLTATAL